MKLLKNPICNLILNFLLVLLYQILVTQLCLFLARQIPDQTTWFDLPLCLHHVLMLLFGLIPVAALAYFQKLDFGFHRSSFITWLFWIGLVVLFTLAVEVVVGAINGFTDTRDYLASDYVRYFTFQFFFSGTGEEVLYRSLPYVILVSSYGKPLETRIGKHIVIDWIVLLTALLFSFAHCDWEFGGDYFDFSITQLIVSFLFGLLMGYCFRKEKNTLLCMTLHGMYNSLLLVFDVLFSLMVYGQ